MKVCLHPGTCDDPCVTKPVGGLACFCQKHMDKYFLNQARKLEALVSTRCRVCDVRFPRGAGGTTCPKCTSKILGH